MPQGGIELAVNDILADFNAELQDLRRADRLHEFTHPCRELIIVARMARLIEIHHHDRKIDPPCGAVDLILLHDIALAQDRCLVLNDQCAAAIAIDDEAAEPKLAVAVALYAKGEQAKGLELGEEAIRIDSRYADLEFLKENLWGERLLAETKKFLANPKIQASITQTQVSPAQVERPPQ